MKQFSGSDEFYFLCLGAIAVCALSYAWCLYLLATSGRNRCVALVAAFVAVLGFVPALPFGRTQELPWLPYAAGIYFFGLTLAYVLWALSPPGRRRDGTRGFDPVMKHDGPGEGESPE